MTTVAYIRVSSDAQDYEYQRREIQRVAAARGEHIAEWYAEKESASRGLKRPELDRLRADVRRGLVRKVYAWRLDRLTRSGIPDTFRVIEELRHHGATLVTVADAFSLDGPAADVVLAVLAWAAQWERKALGDRISAARARVKADGGAWGRPRRVTKSTEKRVLALRAERMTIREIAVALKIPKATVSRVLSQKGAYEPTNGTSRKKGLKNSEPPPSQ